MFFTYFAVFTSIYFLIFSYVLSANSNTLSIVVFKLIPFIVGAVWGLYALKEFNII